LAVAIPLTAAASTKLNLRIEFVRALSYAPPMPLYEFHCEKCQKDSELLVRSADWKGAKCPHCGSTRLAKKLSVFASTGGGGGGDFEPACSGNPGSCGMCGTGRPHSH
jgi:putative FmdB family regulatory protein